MPSGAAPRSIRIGTRSTRLARAQTELIVAPLRATAPHCRIEIVPISTRGDQKPDTPIPQIGNKGVFTAELEAALHQGDIDLAVHSAKDLAADDPAGLSLLAIPARENPQDAWLSAVADFSALPAGATVGTSSVRRMAQLMQLRNDLNYVPLRGAVDTRIRKVLEEKQLAGMVLAAAGLKRLGLSEHIRHLFSVEECVPAPGQGCLAVQGRQNDQELRDLLQPLHNPDAAVELACERRVASLLKASCRTPLGVLARVEGLALKCRVCLVTPSADTRIGVCLASGVGGWMSLADRVVEALRQSGAEELLAQIRI